jgi:hypothetical protein
MSSTTAPSADTAMRTPWLRIITLVFVSRLLLFFVGLFTLYSHGREAHLDWATWIDLSCRWDCSWYRDIAAQGYQNAEAALDGGVTNWAFYPLMPMLAHASQALPGLADFRAAGTLLSSSLFILALGFIYRYARLLGNSERIAATSVMMIAFLPQSIVFSAPYTESLFLCLLAATLVGLRQQQFVFAGVCAALLSATRSSGVFVIVFILVHLYIQLGPRVFFSPWQRPQAFVPLLMAPLGAFAFWTYAYFTTGDAFAMTSAVRHGWGWSWESPLSNLGMFWKTSTDARFWVLGSLFTAACSALLLRYRWYAEFAFCAVVFFVIWGGTVPNSLWRYSMILFPVWIALARLLDTRESMRMGLFAAMGLIGGYVMHAWALQLLVSI